QGTWREPSAEGFDGGSQPALVTGSGVLVDDALVRDGVDDAHRCAELGGRRRLVTGGNGLAHGLDGGAQPGAQAAVVLVELGRLASPLAGRCDIRHVVCSWYSCAG